MKNNSKISKEVKMAKNEANKYATKTVGEFLTPQLVKVAKNTHKQ